MDQDRVCHVAEGFRKMVAKAAWKAWKKLPAHTKIWISVEDLIQEGMNWVTMVGIPKWNKSRSQCLSTFVQIGVSNLIFDGYGNGRGLQTMERRESRVVSFEDLTSQFDERGRKVNMDRLYRPAVTDRTPEVVRNCFAVPLVMEVHRQASKNLKTELVKWFVTSERLKLNTVRFLTAKTEFERLAKMEGLDIDDCRHLMNSPICLEDLSRRLGVQ